MWPALVCGSIESPGAAPKALRCLNHLHSLLSQPQTVIELGARRGWLEILFNVYEQRKGKIQYSCTRPKATTLIVQSNGYNSHTVCVCLNYTRTTEQNWKTKHWSKFISFSLFKETPLLCTWTGCICFHVRIGQLIIITLVMGETCLVRRLFSSDKFLPRIGYADMLTTSGEKNNKVCGFIVYLLRPSVKKTCTAAMKSL